MLLAWRGREATVHDLADGRQRARLEHPDAVADGLALAGGVVVTRDGTVIVIGAGDTVWTPGGEDHWHGALDNQMMCHLAMLESDGHTDPTTWLEPVDDAKYARAMNAVASVDLPAPDAPVSSTPRPSLYTQLPCNGSTPRC